MSGAHLAENGISTAPVDLNALIKPMGVENLVATGRVPSIFRFSSGSRNMAILLVPPEGTQPGDSIERGTTEGGGGDVGIIKFVSPDGKSRGYASYANISLKQANALEPRIQTALQELKTSK